MYCSTESAPTSPCGLPASSAANGEKNRAASKKSDTWLETPVLPVLSSSAPEREGIWLEVKRRVTERTPKSVPPKVKKNKVTELVTVRVVELCVFRSV